MKLEVKYLFPTLSSGANFYIYQLPAGLGMRKISPHSIRMQNNPQTRVEMLWIFTGFHGVMQVESPTCTPYRNFINGIANPEIVYFFNPIFFLSGFSFTTIQKSQDCRGRGRAFL